VLVQEEELAACAWVARGKENVRRKRGAPEAADRIDDMGLEESIEDVGSSGQLAHEILKGKSTVRKRQREISPDCWPATTPTRSSSIRAQTTR